MNKSLDNISNRMKTIKPLFDTCKSTKSGKDKNVFRPIDLYIYLYLT